MRDIRLRGTMSDRGRVVSVIQARMGSSRLPGKTLLDLSGVPILGHVITRTRGAKLADATVVATTTLTEDDVIEGFCSRSNVPCYRGDPKDVLHRYLGAIDRFEADVVVRITADCPLIDPSIIDKVVQIRSETGAQYASNGQVRGWPRGLDVEAYEASALGEASRYVSKQYEREHVTPAIYEHSDRFRCVNVEAPPDEHAPDLRVCVDTREDLDVVRALVASVSNPMKIRAAYIVSFLRLHPEIASLNRAVHQKRLGE